VHRANWFKRKEKVSKAFISKLEVKECSGKCATSHMVYYMLDLVGVKFCPDKLFILYYITVQIAEAKPR
jgi:hypothetical protein